MANVKYRSKARQMRSEDERVPERMPDVHRVWIGYLLDLCLAEGVGFYCGKWTAAGKCTLRFYVDDDQAETFITSRDDPARIVTAAALDLFGEKKAEVMARAAAASTAQLAPRASKTP